MSSQEQATVKVQGLDRLYEDDEPQPIKTRREALAALERVFEDGGEFWPLMPTAQEVAQIYSLLAPAEQWAVCDTMQTMLHANPELRMQESVEAIRPILDGLQTGTMSHPIALLESINMLRKLESDDLRGVLSLINWYYTGAILPSSEE